MERPVSKPIGTSLYYLDTPALFINKANIQANISKVDRIFTESNKFLRPDMSIHGSPTLGQIQIQADHSKGIYVHTLSQALKFSEAGYRDITIGMPVIGSGKSTFALEMSRDIKISIPITNLNNAKNISHMFSESGMEILFYVPISNSIKSIGLSMTDDITGLVNEIKRLGNLKFNGYFVVNNEDQNIIDETFNSQLSSLIESTSSTQSTHLNMAISSSNIDQDLGKYSLFDEIINGTYLFDSSNEDFDIPACGVLSSVMSHPEENNWYLDCGQKAISIDRGLPTINKSIGVKVDRMSAEHGCIVSTGTEKIDLKLGDRIILNPANIGDAFNLYDFINVIDDGKLTNVWTTEARGHYR